MFNYIIAISGPFGDNSRWCPCFSLDPEAMYILGRQVEIIGIIAETLRITKNILLDKEVTGRIQRKICSSSVLSDEGSLTSLESLEKYSTLMY